MFILALFSTAGPLIQLPIAIVLLSAFIPVLTLVLLRILTPIPARPTINSQRVLVCSLLVFLLATGIGLSTVYFGVTTPGEAQVVIFVMTIGGMALLYNYITTPKYKTTLEGVFE